MITPRAEAPRSRRHAQVAQARQRGDKRRLQDGESLAHERLAPPPSAHPPILPTINHRSMAAAIQPGCCHPARLPPSIHAHPRGALWPFGVACRAREPRPPPSTALRPSAQPPNHHPPNHHPLRVGCCQPARLLPALHLHARPQPRASSPSPSPASTTPRPLTRARAHPMTHHLTARSVPLAGGHARRL